MRLRASGVERSAGFGAKPALLLFPHTGELIGTLEKARGVTAISEWEQRRDHADREHGEDDADESQQRQVVVLHEVLQSVGGVSPLRRVRSTGCLIP